MEFTPPCEDAEIAKIAVSLRRESNFQGSGAVKKLQKRHPKAASEATSVPRGPGRPARARFLDDLGVVLGPTTSPKSCPKHSWNSDVF